MLSLIIPTRNEAVNLEILVPRLRLALNGEPSEVIFVDDSTDCTPMVLEGIVRQDPAFQLLHRESESSLGSAILCGFECACGDVLAVMDADLQHPPELLAPMLRSIQSGADIVIASRFMGGGSPVGFRTYRRTLAECGRWMGRLALRKVRSISDPLSGFFMLRRCILHEMEWTLVSWKVLLEILVKGNYQNVVEIPYAFQQRLHGESKLTFKDQLNYVIHVLGLVYRESFVLPWR